jgi:aspartyl-tRNA(Asn)/glutamyl-tRNA(Gln) amidotransferase subunit A
MTAAPHELSIAQAGAALRDGALTSVGLTEHALARIAALDPQLHAFVHVCGERALADAAHADRELGAGHDRGPLHGIPYAVKDVFATAGIPTTCHSRLRLDHVPDEDATVVERLSDAGAVLLGKLATHELALGGPSFDLPFPPARNPWDLERIPGASSSGSGVAVAAGFVRAALGTDTSGSIRGPACHCGVVGLKPTFGLVPRRGAFPLSYALDHCGPLGASVADVAVMLEAIAGHDPRDPASTSAPRGRFADGLDAGVEGLRVIFPRATVTDSEDAAPELIGALDAAAETLVRLGATVESAALPDMELFEACGRVIMAAEGFAIHERELRIRPHDFGRFTYQRLAAGAVLSAADLTHAMRVRSVLTRAVDELLADCDLILTAVALTPPPRFRDFPRDWPPPRAAVATHTIAFNVTGHPALAVPVGVTPEGLPLGAQLVGSTFDERTVLRAGAALEAAIRPGVSKRTLPVA